MRKLSNTKISFTTFLLLFINSFEEKIEKIGSIGPFIDQLKSLFDRFRKKSGMPYELLIIGGALLYFISPVGVIPDYIFPIGSIAYVYSQYKIVEEGVESMQIKFEFFLCV